MKFMENAIMYLFRSFKIQKRKQLKCKNGICVSTRICMALDRYCIMDLLK